MRPMQTVNFSVIYQSKITSEENIKKTKPQKKMPHATATLNGKVIAETGNWEYVEGNIYVGQQFPMRAPMLMMLVPAQLRGPVST